MDKESPAGTDSAESRLGRLVNHPEADRHVATAGLMAGSASAGIMLFSWAHGLWQLGADPALMLAFGALAMLYGHNTLQALTRPGPKRRARAMLNGGLCLALVAGAALQPAEGPLASALLIAAVAGMAL